MSKIEAFLEKFDDQHLANLQCAAEDGKLSYFFPSCCLLHYHQGDYWETKHGELKQLATEAEEAFKKLGFDQLVAELTGNGDDKLRLKHILPLIQAEWIRRAQPVPVIFPQPQTTEVSR